jgi:hypothetical protein
MRRPGGCGVVETLERRVLFAAAVAAAAAEAGPAILFVRGAVRSGGFLEGSNAATRNEQLADVDNTSTAAGNAGWGTLAATLREAGFTVDQVNEAMEAGAPGSGLIDGRAVRLENLDLSNYAAIVFGSNNARSARVTIDAVENYVRNGGGGALFISDANFGSNWRDAADSDQQFLARFGLIVNQDSASGTAALMRSGGDFAVPDHPVLNGVDAFDGEGVSPIIVPPSASSAAAAGVTIARIVGVRGQTRNNDGIDPQNQFQGSLRDVTEQDAALVLANAGRGRVATFFDRNTFFNANGVGTDITKFDNRQLALNLFGWVADQTPPAVAASSFEQGAPSEVRLTFDDDLFGSLTRRDVLLREALDGAPIPRKRWSFAVTESPASTELLVRVKGAQPPGLYQLQINPGHIRDDAGNVNPKRVRFNFTIASQAPISAGVPAAAARATAHDTDDGGKRPADDLFGETPVVR